MQKKRLLKRILLAAALLVLTLPVVLWLYLGSDAFSRRAQDWIVSSLQSRYPVEAEVDSVRLRLWGLVFEMEGFRIFEAGRPQAEPAIELDRALVDLPAGILLGGGIRLDRLELDRPVIRIRRKADGRLNLADMFRTGAPQSGSPPPSVSIGALSIRNGLLRYNQRDIPLNFSRFGFEGEIASTSTPGQYSGRLTLDGFELKTEKITLPPSQIGLEFRADSRQADHVEAFLRSRGLEAALEGRISDLEELRYEFDLDAKGDFDAIRSPGFLTQVEGVLFESRGRLSGQGSEFRYQGGLQAERLTAFGLLFEGLAVRLDADAQRIRFEGLEARIRKGEVRASGALGLQPQAGSRMELAFKDFDWSGWIPYLEGRSDLKAQLDWPALEWQELSGKGRLDYRLTARLDQIGEDRLLEPLSMQGGSSLQMTGLAVRLPDASAQGQGARVSFEAQVHLDSLKYAVAFDALDEQGERLLAALLEKVGDRIPQSVRRGLSLQGALQARGQLTGIKNEFQLAGSLHDSQLAWEAEPLGRLEADFRIADGLLHVDGTHLEGRGVALESAQARIPFDNPQDSSVALQARLSGFPLARLHSLISELASDDLLPQGRLSGLVRFSRPQAEEWQLEGRLRAEALSMQGLRFDSLQGHVDVGAQAVRLQDVEARIGTGTIGARLDFDRNSGQISGQAEGKNIPLTAIPMLQERLALQGEADFHLTAQGPWEHPQVEARLDSRKLACNGLELEEIRISATGSREQMHFEASHRMMGSRLESSGEMQLVSPWQLQAEVKLDEVPLAPYALWAAPQKLAGVDGRASGTIHLDGPLSQPDRLNAQVRLDRLALETAGYRVENQEGPFQALWSNGRVEISPVQFRGPETSLQFSGRLQTVEPRSLQLRLDGRSNLRVLNDLIPAGVIWGDVEVSMVVSGDWESPRLVGNASVENAFFFNPALPTPLIDAAGTFKFSPSLLSIDRFSARTRYGRIQALGGVFLDGFQPARWKINVFGKRLQVEFPSGAFSTVDADLDLLKSDAGQLVTGKLTVLSSQYSQPVSLTDLVTGYLNQRQPVLYEGPGKEVDLDISVQGSRTLSISNNLADLRASASLNIRGTVANPVILGVLRVDEGKLFLEDNDYDINRGTINFNDPRRTTPNLNFEAETTVRDYVVTATVQGTLDRPNIRFRSDPPLPTADIISLLAVGETLSELSGETGTTVGSGLGVAAAGRVLSRALQDSLQTQTAHLFGLQKFSVDPFIAGTGRRNPGARITIGRQLGKNVTVSYITDLGSETSGQIVIVEVQLQSWLTAVGSREEDGSLAIDFKLRKRF